MKYKKIVLAGGNGYLGRVLSNHYKFSAEEIVILSRSNAGEQDNIKTVQWDGKTEGEWIDYIEGADLLINLCGKNVNCRYTEANRTEIIRSRIEPTTLLGNVIGRLQNLPSSGLTLLQLQFTVLPKTVCRMRKQVSQVTASLWKYVKDGKALFLPHKLLGHGK